MEFHGITLNCAVLYSENFAELREIKSDQYKIPYFAEFQKGTFENTLVKAAYFLGYVGNSNFSRCVCLKKQHNLASKKFG